MNTPTETLDALFPIVPGPPPSPLSPSRLPGITHESSAALQKLLQENHKKWHIFFNDKGFHNHVSHHLLAIYYLGARAPLLEAAYDAHVSYMRPAFESPESIDEQNFHEHLGDERFYNSYLEFFSSAVLEKGAEATIEEYVFSPKANILPPASGKQPMHMLNRFLAGLLHPLIHTGYGAEFGLLGMVAEGLAQTAVHRPGALVLTPPSLFEYALATSSDRASASISRLTSLLPSLVVDKAQSMLGTTLSSPQKGVHALTIVSRLLHDPTLSAFALGLTNLDENELPLQHVLHLRSTAILEAADEWGVDATNAENVAAKIEELIWMNVVFYGVGGWVGRKSSGTGEFNADFFFVHLVTSVLFLHSLVAHLSPTSTAVLLRTYFTNSLALYLSRGRPALPIREFYDAAPDTLRVPGAHPDPATGALVPADTSPNDWLPLLQTTLMHPDDHLCKLQRALAHFSALYGTRGRGHFKHLEEGAHPLEGAERLDGTLFVRVAGLTADRLGWIREGEEKKGWDFASDGFFE
ncbi:hypothetical protein B0H21DRAFT_574991 [Amylocystis lapponica]|nr:hypothetical protein B0H21DRAFT_574991 [Amylocystis lapponica]